jgi:hypothetical protein
MSLRQCCSDAESSAICQEADCREAAAMKNNAMMRIRRKKTKKKWKFSTNK